jgi:hypothetical protein
LVEGGVGLQDNNSAVPVTYRPKFDSPAVVKAAVSQMLLPSRDWLTERGLEMDDGKLGVDLSMALTQTYNGYEMAKYLEYGAGWQDVDAELVSVLEAGRKSLHYAHRAAIRQWIVDSNIRPLHRIGDEVTHKLLMGTVVSIDHENGTYGFLTLHIEYQHGPRGIPFEEIDGYNRGETAGHNPSIGAQ